MAKKSVEDLKAAYEKAVKSQKEREKRNRERVGVLLASYVMEKAIKDKDEEVIMGCLRATKKVRDQDVLQEFLVYVRKAGVEEKVPENVKKEKIIVAKAPPKKRGRKPNKA